MFGRLIDERAVGERYSRSAAGWMSRAHQAKRHYVSRSAIRLAVSQHAAAAEKSAGR
jgi:hypothetical protein